LKHLLISLLCITFISCSQEQNRSGNKTATEPGLESHLKTESDSLPRLHNNAREDSMVVLSFIRDLKGIEKFVVKDNFELLAGLLKYKAGNESYQGISLTLEKIIDKTRKFSFSIIDPRNGYVQYSQDFTDATYTMTYWNLNDGTKLIGTETWFCGPICESEISFQKYENNQYESVKNEDIIPEINLLRKIIYPNYDPDGEPEEFKFILPQVGKDIQFILNDRSIELEWQNGVFKMVEEYHYL